jgi:hypothetical protein
MAVLTACKAAKEISNDVKDVAEIKNYPQDRGNYHLGQITATTRIYV